MVVRVGHGHCTYSAAWQPAAPSIQGGVLVVPLRRAGGALAAAEEKRGVFVARIFRVVAFQNKKRGRFVARFFFVNS